VTLAQPLPLHHVAVHSPYVTPCRAGQGRVRLAAQCSISHSRIAACQILLRGLPLPGMRSKRTPHQHMPSEGPVGNAWPSCSPQNWPVSPSAEPLPASVCTGRFAPSLLSHLAPACYPQLPAHTTRPPHTLAVHASDSQGCSPSSRKLSQGCPTPGPPQDTQGPGLPVYASLPPRM